MEWWGWLILIVVNTPVILGIGWVIFSTWEEFFACVKFWLTPDVISMFRGEYEDDFFAELKLFVWLALCAGAVGLQYWLLIHYVL